MNKGTLKEQRQHVPCGKAAALKVLQSSTLYGSFHQEEDGSTQYSTLFLLVH